MIAVQEPASGESRFSRLMKVSVQVSGIEELRRELSRRQEVGLPV
jgi:predicted nucleotidyltransferase